MSGNAHGYKYNTITIVDEKISRPDSAGCQEESDQPKREVIWSFQTFDHSMNICSLTNAMVAKKRSNQPNRGVMLLPPTVAQLVVLLVDLHHSPPQLVGQASFGGDTKQGGIKADIQARAKLDNQAKSLLMSRFDRFILLIYGLSTSS